MKSLLRAGLLCWIALLAGLPGAWGQTLPRIHKILIRNVGPPAAGDALVLANIRSKEGEPLSRATVDEDIKSLYATGFFFKIQVGEENTPDGIDLTYVLQGKPILTEIFFVGNKKMSTSKLKKKVTSKINQPLDERKLFNDAQEMQKLYEKAGYQKTTVKVLPPSIDETTGRGTITFEIHEMPKVRIKDVIFDNETAFPQKVLRKTIKTRRHWMFSWITGSGVLKEDEFEDDKDKLVEYFQNKGYIDMSLQDVKFNYVSPTRMVIHFDVSQGRQYKVGTVDFKGNKLFTTNDFLHGVVVDKQRLRIFLQPGEIFTPVGFEHDKDTIRDIYGSKGYLDREQNGNTIILGANIPNTTTGTMDLSYNIEEGEKCYIEKIEIKGNVKTKDQVIRRELAVYPGEVYDMVRVKLSKERLEGLDFFEKVDTEAEDTDVPNRKNLVVGLEEKNTGNVTVGAGFSSVDSLVGFVEVRQGDFDLFNPPTFMGAGQKFQARASIGTELQDYEISFVEPWFTGRKLALGVDLFHKFINYDSLNDIYTETYDGGSVSLTRALGSDFLIGKVSYTLEQAHIAINPGFNLGPTTNYYQSANGLFHPTSVNPPNLSRKIFDTHGNYGISKLGFSLAYDTRNSLKLPNRGQRTEISAELAAPFSEFYKLELKSSWYFNPLKPIEDHALHLPFGHVLEIGGRAGVVQSLDSSAVPLFERWYLGGLYSLRGYKYRQIGPQDGFGEPLGGDTYFYGTAEYSIPIVKMVRFAVFYDAGNVFSDAYSFNAGPGHHFYQDDWGVGLRLNLPIGPLILDYAFPMTHDSNVNGNGRVQIGVGYQRDF